MKKIVLFICLVIFSLSLSGCKPDSYIYDGDYPEVYSVVLNTIPGAEGYMLSECYQDPRIEFIEEDQFGRKMYLYYEGKSISTYSLIIVQYSDAVETCYYLNRNFISSNENNFTESNINSFKAENDWNCEINNDEFTCIPISTLKGPSPLTYEQIKPFYEEIFPGDEHFSDDRWIEYFVSDEYGRIMFTVEVRFESKWAIMMFFPDGTYDSENGFLILTDFYTYQNQLKEFEESNNWNEPLE
ncbi:MAG: hypothetical protein PHT27_06335 [Candidatus Izemoplasmatales bacterium]|nr:hypothetical protein [Candidatus Izemoplasmatales bacterium]